MKRRTPFGWSTFTLGLAGILCAIGLTACGGGGGGGGGPIIPPPIPVEPPPPTTPILSTTDNLPGVVWTILGVFGGTGPGGNPQPGDTLDVDFTIKTKSNAPIAPADMNTFRIYVSGPTFNYQIVIPRQDDGRARSTQNMDGTWRYTFGIPIPAVYDAPPNDTASFGPTDGEMTGDALIPGTYTVGMEGYKLYKIDNVDYRDAGNATFDFLLGSATMLEHREVVKVENCEQCHVDLRAHGGTRREVKNCILCHVSGSEDRNSGGATPGASIDFRVMIHKIHNGQHLPSVNGVGTNSDGSRNYDQTPQPYLLAGNSTHDYSHVPFPVWPNLTFAMPRDLGYSALTSTQKAQEDQMLRGVTRCDKCHGDPDGAAGPLTAPAQGGNAYTESTRRACGSCHDDIDWAKPYAANLLEMPPQTDDLSCNFCHGNTGALLNPAIAHVHPINDSTLNPGIHFVIQNVTEAGMHNSDGKLQSGERVSVTFDMHDDAGNPVTTAAWAAGSSAGTVNFAIAGPTTNRNILINTSLPLASVTGSGPYTINLPEIQLIEFVGDSSATMNETFTTSRTPHRNVAGALTSVFVRTANGSTATVANAVRQGQNYIDLVAGFNTDPGTGGFARDRYVVVEDDVAGKEEYLRVQFVDGNRIWFGSLASTAYQPGTRVSHAAGAVVQVVTLTQKTVGTQFTVDALMGQITEVGDFGNGLAGGNAVLVTYTSDFVMPAFYPPSINDGASFDETYGEWTSLPLESGTYTLGFWASKTFAVSAFSETQSYRNTSVNDEAQWNFLVGNATTIVPETIISSKDNCNACHDTVYAHGGGREGYNTCILCHGAAGGEDRPRYVAANAPDTPGVGIDFRYLLHRIHMGEDLSTASTWQIVGFGSTPYPNNYGTVMYDEVVFPALPGGVLNCEKCHGVGNPAWKVPTDRTHPLQMSPTLSWRVACGSCHDDVAVEAHIKAQTSPSGVESCSICHGPGQPEAVENKHKPR